DLIDPGMPWVDSDKAGLGGVAAHELCDRPAWECVCYFPSHLSITTEDASRFAGTRRSFVTVDEAKRELPVLALSCGPDNGTLSFYSYFFYLDADARGRAHRALRAMQPKSELAAFAGRVARDLGPFNAVHVRRGDFKKTRGVTTLERSPGEVIRRLD